MRNRKGFTLVEMLVVIAIIMLLAALLVMLIANTLGQARNAKTKSLIDMLAAGCEAYKTDFHQYPGTGSGLQSSKVLHKALGSKRLVNAAFGATAAGDIKVVKPALVEFHADQLRLGPGVTDVEPAAGMEVEVIDAWDEDIQYRHTLSTTPGEPGGGVYNKNAPDIWSNGRDKTFANGILPNDDITNWQKD